MNIERQNGPNTQFVRINNDILINISEISDISYDVVNKRYKLYLKRHDTVFSLCDETGQKLLELLTTYDLTF